jgi:hypothetical protein
LKYKFVNVETTALSRVRAVVPDAGKCRFNELVAIYKSPTLEK